MDSGKKRSIKAECVEQPDGPRPFCHLKRAACRRVAAVRCDFSGHAVADVVFRQHHVCDARIAGRVLRLEPQKGRRQKPGRPCVPGFLANRFLSNLLAGRFDDFLRTPVCPENQVPDRRPCLIYRRKAVHLSGKPDCPNLFAFSGKPGGQALNTRFSGLPYAFKVLLGSQRRRPLGGIALIGASQNGSMQVYQQDFCPRCPNVVSQNIFFHERFLLRGSST